MIKWKIWLINYLLNLKNSQYPPAIGGIWVIEVYYSAFYAELICTLRQGLKDRCWYTWLDSSYICNSYGLRYLKRILIYIFFSLKTFS